VLPGSRYARVIVFIVVAVLALSMVLSAVASPIGV
jgi:hypothetical protein